MIQHYMPLCDEYGLYLIDECNMETHGMWDMVGRGVLAYRESITR